MKFIKKNYVVIRQLKEDQPSSVILLPEIYRKPIMQGIVLAVGRGTKEMPPNVREGDLVTYNDRSSTIQHLEVNKEDVVVMQFTDILTIIHERKEI